MPDLLGTSLSGMLAFQRAMEMTGHNIANANTPGYSRQVAEFSTRVGQGSGNGFIGSGTQITTIKRVYDEMLGEQLQASTASFARFDALDSLSSRVDQMLADADTGLSSGMASFFNSIQDLANDPSSIPARQAVLGQADGLTQRFQSLGTQLNAMDLEVNQRIEESVNEINRMAESIAQLNDQVVLAQGRTGQPPNDLLDQRDLAIRQLSEQVSVSTIAQDDGSLNVFMGSGQALVTGTDVKFLATTSSEFDPTRAEVIYLGSSGNSRLDESLTGGKLGGYIEFRSRMLDPTRQSLGQTALAVAVGFNEQHAAGLDLRGNLGGQFFSISSPDVLASSGNSGAGTANAIVADTGAVTGDDYILEYDGATYSLLNASNGQPVAISGSGSVADPFVADGLQISVAGAPAAGDRLLIRPTRNVATSISRTLDDAHAIAMASPVRTVGGNNIGDATISSPQVVDINDANLLSTSVIEFTAPNIYSVNGAGAFAYVSGDPILLNGVSVTIDGTPSVGDQFTVEANAAASGDNANGLLLADVQAEGILSGGTLSINESYGQLVANVGSTTHQIKTNRDAQSVVLANNEQAQLSKSGVNLDEEAANLIRFQQAYQAVAQVVSVANTIFDSLLNATRR